MTEEELDRLASLIAKSLLDAQRAASSPGAASSANRKTWLPTPVRPEYRDREAAGVEPPVWSGAGQSLDDVAPGRSPSMARGHRVSTAELTNATRAAAAGRAQPAKTHAAGRVHPSGRSRSQDAPAIDVPIGISNRHIHLSQTHFRILFGADSPSAERPIKQPGQFAAKETVDVVAPAGRVDKVRVVGPARGETQLELALSDCRRIGITPPVAASGALAGSGGGVTLVGPAGSVPLTRGVIVASHHLHLSATDARRWGLHDGDRLDVRCGAGDRRVTLHDVLVRAGPTHATELHLDSDEAFAAGVKSGDTARILAWRAAPARKRPLVTERDVKEMALRAESLPPDAILTPSARDRARSLNLLPP